MIGTNLRLSRLDIKQGHSCHRYCYKREDEALRYIGSIDDFRAKSDYRVTHDL